MTPLHCLEYKVGVLGKDGLAQGRRRSSMEVVVVQLGPKEPPALVIYRMCGLRKCWGGGREM